MWKLLIILTGKNKKKDPKLYIQFDFNYTKMIL